MKEGSRAQSAAFADESSKVLQEAVDLVNATHPGARAIFVDVRSQWLDVNAYGAPSSYFWHFTGPRRPPDHTTDARNEICKTHNRLLRLFQFMHEREDETRWPLLVGPTAH